MSHGAWGWTYCFEVVGYDIAKIGCSKRPFARMSSLRPKIPFRVRAGVKLKMIGAIWGRRTLEHRMHSRFAAQHLKGEWFRITPAMRRLFKRHPMESPAVVWARHLLGAR